MTMARTHASATGIPGPIPPVGRSSTARQTSGRCWLAPGWPESTGLCGTAAAEAGAPSARVRVPREQRGGE